MIDTTIKVPDMSCGHCKATIERELNEFSGVESSFADLEKGAVAVRHDENRVSPEQLKGAIEEAGYTVAA
jgi:copper chaperone